MDKEKTGELIKEARASKGYTQQELGDLLGVSNKAVSRWEKGESFPDVALLENMASVLDLKIQDLVIGEVQPDAPEMELAMTDMVRQVRLQMHQRWKLLWSAVIVVAVMALLLMTGTETAHTVFLLPQ